jgi:hypothetical protein
MITCLLSWLDQTRGFHKLIGYFDGRKAYFESQLNCELEVCKENKNRLRELAQQTDGTAGLCRPAESWHPTRGEQVIV